MITAVLGGSFDPVHDGHLAIVERIRTDGMADRVLVIPAWRSPHKQSVTASARHRLAMVQLAFASEPKVVVDSCEIERPGPSYTVETLEALHASRPDERLRLVMGADNLGGFLQWRHPERILELAEIILLARPGWTLEPADLIKAGLGLTRVHVVRDFLQPVSSSEIRAMLARNEPVSAGLPPQVADYIASHELYRD